MKSKHLLAMFFVVISACDIEIDTTNRKKISDLSMQKIVLEGASSIEVVFDDDGIEWCSYDLSYNAVKFVDQIRSVMISSAWNELRKDGLGNWYLDYGVESIQDPEYFYLRSAWQNSKGDVMNLYVEEEYKKQSVDYPGSLVRVTFSLYPASISQSALEEIEKYSEFSQLIESVKR